jgi:hypothetical protein
MIAMLCRSEIRFAPVSCGDAREFERFYNGHRPHQGIANARPLCPLLPPITDPDQIAPSEHTKTPNTSAASSTSTNMSPDVHGWNFRQAQG